MHYPEHDGPGPSESFAKVKHQAHAVPERRLRSARSEYAELISLRVGENNPRLLALPDVRWRGPELRQPPRREPTAKPQ